MPSDMLMNAASILNHSNDPIIDAEFCFHI
jgi:hypothetical protein